MAVSSTGTASYSRVISLTRLAVSIAAVTLIHIFKPFAVLGVLIKILNDPRNIVVIKEDRTFKALDDPRVIYIDSRK
jgi:hypothetical protein